jgi:ABC-2 type transport system permease protein
VTAVLSAADGARLQLTPDGSTSDRPAVPSPGRVQAFTRLLAAERIKLGSTRSPWWCAAVVVLVLVGVTALVALLYVPEEHGPAWLWFRGTGALPTAVVAVLAALAVTNEYRTGTVRTTFLAAPNRAQALLAKTVVVAAAAAVIGLVASFTAWGLARVLAPQADLALTTAAQWRALAGVGAVYAVVAVLSVAVAILVRHGAGAITVLMIWILVGESLVGAIPRVGPDIAAWLPMQNLTRFLVAGLADPDPGRSFFGEQHLFGPWAALGYSTAVAIALLAAAVAVARRRDA